jgi:ketosteroid isomerase-like protein
MTKADEIRRAIERQNEQAARAYATGDVESLATVFADDAWQMPPNLPALVGAPAIVEFWRHAFGWGTWAFSFQTQSVHSSGAIAVERGKYAVRFTAGMNAPLGMGSFDDRGNYLVHWRHDSDGQWRIVADAPVSELPIEQRQQNGPQRRQDQSS